MRTFAQSPKVQLSASAKVTGPVSAHSKHAPDFNAIPSPVASVHAPNLTGIPPTVRARMERSLRTDFSDVRVETDSAHAVKIRAEAFTQGSYIHVAPGYWAPETPKGLRLLGHELGHVLQQRSGRVPTTGYLAGTALNDDPALEREADEFGRQAEYSAREALPPCASPGRGGQKSSQGVAQRSPIDKGDPIHGPMLDEFSKETGTPRDTASQHDPAFQAWLTVRNLDRQSMGEILASLDDTESRGELNSLIAAASVVPPPRYKRVTTAMKVVRQSRGAGANSQTALATIASEGLPAADQLAMRHFVNVPATHGADQRAAIAPGGAAALPNAGLTRDIGFEIDPGSRPAPVAPPVNQPPGVPPPPPPPRGRRVPRVLREPAAAVGHHRDPRLRRAGRLPRHRTGRGGHPEPSVVGR